MSTPFVPSVTPAFPTRILHHSGFVAIGEMRSSHQPQVGRFRRFNAFFGLARSCEEPTAYDFTTGTRDGLHIELDDSLKLIQSVELFGPSNLLQKEYSLIASGHEYLEGNSAFLIVWDRVRPTLITGSHLDTMIGQFVRYARSRKN